MIEIFNIKKIIYRCLKIIDINIFFFKIKKKKKKKKKEIFNNIIFIYFNENILK